MKVRGRLAMMLIVAVFFGGDGPLKAWASTADTAGKAGASAPSSPAASPEETRIEYINDPSMNNMNAVSVTIPAKWHFQGVLFQAGQCATIPYFVFRASSPDGLSFVERLPALSWTWGTGPMAGNKSKDCLPLQGPMTAQEFLKYLSTTLKVDYVSDEPFPAEQVAAVQKGVEQGNQASTNNYLKPKNSVDLTQAQVRYKNGTFVMKGLLSTRVDCTEQTFPGMKSILRGMPDRPESVVHHCTASVRYLVAPEAQFPAVRKMWEPPAKLGGQLIDTWVGAWLQRNREQAQQAMQQNLARTQAQMQAQQRQFNHDQAVRQQMHEQFLASMQRGTDMSMARANASMNARSTATSDWVDYALDQKTVMDPNTGQINKVSSSYSHTWVDSTGKVSYQTNDPNANPNGVLPGNWTQQQVVHGDGTQ
jgi:hypothetical protein